MSSTRSKGKKNTALSIIIILVIFLALFLIIETNLKLKVPIAYISSGSMEPTYMTGDLVIISDVNAEDLKIGDVIVFRNPMDPNELILHRIVAIKKDNGNIYFLTKGDNPQTNPRIDPWGWVPENYIYGKLVFRVPIIGYLLIITSNLFLRVFFAFIIGILLLISVIFPENSGKENKSIKLRKFSFLRMECVLLLIILISAFYTYRLSASSTTLSPSINVLELKLNGKITAFDSSQQQYLELRIIIRVRSPSYRYIIKNLEITLYNDTDLIGETAWSIIYPFIGDKIISLGIITTANVTVSHEYEVKGIVYYTDILAESIEESKIFQQKVVLM